MGHLDGRREWVTAVMKLGDGRHGNGDGRLPLKPKKIKITFLFPEIPPFPKWSLMMTSGDAWNSIHSRNEELSGFYSEGSLLKQLAIANKSVGGGVIVVLAEKENEGMEMDIAKLEFDFMGTSVICRSGSPLILADLKKVLEALLAPASELWMFNEVPKLEREKKLVDDGLDVSELENIKLVHMEGNCN